MCALFMICSLHTTQFGTVAKLVKQFVIEMGDFFFVCWKKCAAYERRQKKKSAFNTTSNTSNNNNISSSKNNKSINDSEHLEVAFVDLVRVTNKCLSFELMLFHQEWKYSFHWLSLYKNDSTFLTYKLNLAFVVHAVCVCVAEIKQIVYVREEPREERKMLRKI